MVNAAKDGLDKEWGNLETKGAWDYSTFKKEFQLGLDSPKTDGPRSGLAHTLTP